MPSCCRTWSMRPFLNSVPLSDKMYCGHMCTDRYSLIKIETIVSADLSGMGNASSHLVKWPIIVRMCLFHDVEILHSVTKSIAILSNGLSGISIICNGLLLNFGFSPSAKNAVCNVFPNVFVHPLPIILAFDEAICVVNYLGDPVCHELPLILCTSKILEWPRLGIFLPVSMTCLYNSPFMWVKVSNSWWGTLPFSNLLEMHLQNGSVFCICSNASRWSTVKGFWGSSGFLRNLRCCI